jgi:putative membrane protein
VLASALAALAMLAAGVWFARFISVAVARDDWIGWTAFTLLVIAALAAGVLAMREVVGLARLGRLGRVRRDAEAALRDRNVAAERRAAQDVAALLRGRADAAWGLARVREHAGDVRDAGDLLVLTERELVVPLDHEARRRVLASAKRISLVTAMSPIALIAVAYVLIENLRMLRGLATLYGGRPGFWGSVRLARHVVAHLVATGGLALTDDLLGQFLGQDVLRRLSRRLGEGAFNGAMTARVGTAAIDVLRPLPFIEATPVRARDILAELFRRPVSSGNAAAGT